jgi:hypothetical protein
MNVAAEIRASSATIRELYARIGETYANRDLSPSRREAWSRACAEFHERYGSLSYPGGDERWQALMALDSAEIETAISLLEEDPFHFRSGYMKEAIWHRLKGARLTPKQMRRLEAAAKGHLYRQIRRDFWYMVRFVRLRGSEEFWNEINDTASQDSGSPGLKAWWMLLARANYPVQHWIGSELLRARYEKGYVANLAFGRRAA